MQEMSIYGVSFDMVGKQPIVLLKTQSGNKFLPIWIGSTEASAILMKLQGVETPRPMTHDLLSDTIAHLNAEVSRVTVTDLRENTFIATITVRADAGEIEIDARPSDALALAVRVDAPIYVDDKVIEDSALEFTEDPDDTDEVVERFKEFLDDVSPDDFAS
jgi:bifunctional DNase/RNase